MCTKKEAEERRKLLLNDITWAAKEAERHRQKAKRQYYKKKADGTLKRISSDVYRTKHPEKYAAVLAAAKYIDIQPGYHRHHWSYQKENQLDVIILKHDFHLYLHRFLKYDKELFCYRIKSTGELLDNREKHERFIDAIKTVDLLVNRPQSIPDL